MLVQRGLRTLILGFVVVAAVLDRLPRSRVDPRAEIHGAQALETRGDLTSTPTREDIAGGLDAVADGTIIPRSARILHSSDGGLEREIRTWKRWRRLHPREDQSCSGSNGNSSACSTAASCCATNDGSSECCSEGFTCCEPKNGEVACCPIGTGSQCENGDCPQAPSIT